MEKSRVHWIDIARAIFIIAIVIGHVFSYGKIRYWVFSFHVPAFFFISGFCFRYKSGFIKMVKEKIRKIVIPYLAFSLLSILVFWIVSLAIPRINSLLECNLLINIRTMVYGNSKPSTMKYNLPLWFLTCFFVVSLVAWIIETINRRWKGSRTVAIVVCMIAGGYLSQCETIILPWHIETAVSMTVWFFIGISIKEHWEYVENKALALQANSSVRWFVAIMMIGVGAIVATINSRIVGVRNDHYGNFAIYYTAAFISIVGIICLSYSLNKNRTLEYIGRHTMAILVLHKFPIIILQEFIKPVAKQLDAPDSVGGIICGSVVASVAIAISLFAGVIIERICPEVLGKARIPMDSCIGVRRD